HESGLGIFREGELLGRPLPDDPGELLIESRIDLSKYLSCRRKGLRERLGHADALTSLTGKNERSGHSSWPYHSGSTARWPLLGWHLAEVTQFGHSPSNVPAPAFDDRSPSDFSM